MITVKCDICGKDFRAEDDKVQFVVCHDCASAKDELTNGKGDE